MNVGSRLLGALVLLAASAPALAQQTTRLRNGYDGDIDLFRPVFAPENLPGIDVPDNMRGGSFRAGVAAMYSNAPLVLYEFDNRIGSIVANRISGYAGLSVDISRKFTARAVLPMYYQTGTSVPKYASDGFALGDLSVGAHWAFFRKPAVGLGLSADLTLPTSRANFYAGERIPRLNPMFLMMFDIGRVRIASNLGANVRFQGIDTKQDLFLGTELVFNNGVRFKIIPDRLDLGLSIYARFGFSNFFGEGESSGEALLSVAYKVSDILWVDLGGGRGFTRGYGASTARAYLGLRFQRVRPPEELDTEFVDPDGQAAGDKDGLRFNVRDIGQLRAGDEGTASEEKPWEEGEFARIEAERIRIRYAIRFKVGTAQLLAESYPTLDFIADKLNNDGRIAHVVIEGHASEDGADDKNYDLSVNRAASIWKRLVEQGVHPSRISFRGMGEVMPAEATGGFDELQSSRRVVFHIVRQYEDWEAPPKYDLDLKYPWNGEPYTAIQPKVPIDDAPLPSELRRDETDSLEGVDFNAPPDEGDMDDAVPPTPPTTDEEAP